MISFAEPLWFLLMLSAIPLLLRARQRRAVRVSSITMMAGGGGRAVRLARHLSLALRLLTLGAICIALARPQSGPAGNQRRSLGLDIMLVVDTSDSMQALDFFIAGQRVDRLQVVKKVLRTFVEARPDDRLGLVVFGAQAFAQAPLTLDHDVLLRYIEDAQIGMAGKFTAIGDGIGVAVNRLKELKAKNRVIILLTDGANTAGKLTPLQAADAAKAMGVKVYTVGIGSKGPVPVQTPFGIQQHVFELDDKLLQAVADKTEGRYFKASTTETLVEIYQTIDKLEKTEVELNSYQMRDERFAPWALLALLLLVAEVWIGGTRLRRIP